VGQKGIEGISMRILYELYIFTRLMPKKGANFLVDAIAVSMLKNIAFRLLNYKPDRNWTYS
jgi:hypothetical protein